MTIADMVQHDLSCGIPDDHCGQCYFIESYNHVRKKYCPYGTLMPAIERQILSPCGCSNMCYENINAMVHEYNCWQNDANSMDVRGCLNRQVPQTCLL